MAEKIARAPAAGNVQPAIQPTLGKQAGKMGGAIQLVVDFSEQRPAENTGHYVAELRLIGDPLENLKRPKITTYRCRQRWQRSIGILQAPSSASNQVFDLDGWT